MKHHRTRIVLNLFTFVICLLTSLLAVAQAPSAFNYQGLARDGAGTAISNQQVGLRISILSDSENGSLVFQEVQTVTTNNRGLFTAHIGFGTVIVGSISEINWGSRPHFIRSEIDINGGNQYVDLGAAQLLSVPYALYASKSGDGQGSTTSDDQVLSFSGTTLSIEDGNSVDLSSLVNDADADPSNELQTLSISGNQVSLSGANSIDLPVNSSPWNEVGNSISYGGDAIRFVNDDFSSAVSMTKFAEGAGFVNIGGGNSGSISISGLTGIQYRDENGTLTSFLSETGGGGFFSIYDNAEVVVDLSGDFNGHGSVETFNNMGQSIVKLEEDNTGGLVTTSSTNNAFYSEVRPGSYSVQNGTELLSYLGVTNEPHGGLFEIHKGGNRAIAGSAGSGNEGLFATYGPNGNVNVLMTTTTGIDMDFGSVGAAGDDDIIRSEVYVAPDNSGQMLTAGPNGSINVLLRTFADDALDFGSVRTFGSDNTLKSSLATSPNNSGQFGTWGPNGNRNIFGSSFLDNFDHPVLAFYNASEETRILHSVALSDAGDMRIYGPNGSENALVSAVFGSENNGYIGVQDPNGSIRAGMFVNDDGQGIVFADQVNSFVENPEKSNERIVYSMIQGPESAAYLRGTAQLNEGSGSVDFPEHFTRHIESEGLTVMLTPLSADSRGIAVTKKGSSGFRVQELLDGKGNYEFDWEVKGVRKTGRAFKAMKSTPQAIPMDTYIDPGEGNTEKPFHLKNSSQSDRPTKRISTDHH